MNSKRVDKLINEVSLLTGYPKKEVKEMWMSQWALLSKTISEANTYDVEFDNIHIVGLAKFYATRKKKRYFETMKQRRNEAKLPNVYPGQRFNLFTYTDWRWLGEAFVRDAAPLYIGNHLMKEYFPRTIEIIDSGENVSGLKYNRIPVKQSERYGYI